MREDMMLYFDRHCRGALRIGAETANYEELRRALHFARKRAEDIAAGRIAADYEPDTDAVRAICAGFGLDPTGAGWWAWLTRRTAEGGNNDKTNA